MTGERSTTVLFDRDCGFCMWIVRQLRALDRHHRFRFVPLQAAAAGPPELAAVAARYPLADWIHVVGPEGRVSARGQALLRILDALPGGWLLRPWARLPFAGPVVDAVYDGIARRRDRLGRLVSRGDPALACGVGPASPT